MATLLDFLHNPYKIIGVQYSDVMEYLETNLSGGMSLDNVNNIVTDYISNLYMPDNEDLFVAQEFKTIIPNAANGYINQGNTNGYNSFQQEFIDFLYKPLICKTEIISIINYIHDVEKNIYLAGLTLEEQAPLLMATSAGIASGFYWYFKITELEANNWYSFNYFNEQPYINYEKLPYIVAAAIKGALYGANKSKSYGLLDPPKKIGVDIVSALTSAVGVSAGMVMFNWTPKIQPNATGGFRL